MGLYHARAGDWETAAASYVQAATIKGSAPKIRAYAAEAYWNSNRPDRAVELAQGELDRISRALGDHDRANYILGLAAYDKKDFATAYEHFESISNREPWKDELEKLETQIKTDILQPARELAERSTTQELLKGTAQE